jgi:hypothetical protein
MKERIQSDIERFRQAVKDNAIAQQRRVEWIERETRSHRLMMALLQLIADGAAEADEDLPADVLHMALIQLPNQGISNEVHKHLQKLQQQKPSHTELAQIVPEPPLPTNNKTEFVRQFVIRNSPTGVTPSEIKKAAALVGIKGMNTNFPHTILWRLKDAGKIREDGGRYFSALVERASSNF